MPIMTDPWADCPRHNKTSVDEGEDGWTHDDDKPIIKSNARRGPDDHFSKHKCAGCMSKGESDGTTFMDKGAAYLPSKKVEVARWFACVSIRNGKVDVSFGDGRNFATFPAAVEFDRQMYDALKAGIEGHVCKI